MFITPYLGKSLSTITWSSFTKSTSYSISVEKDGIYEVFTNGTLTVTGATILSKYNCNGFYACLFKADSNNVSITSQGSAYYVALSDKLK